MLYKSYLMFYKILVICTKCYELFVEAFTPPMFRTGKDKDGFSLGKYNNFQEVFGDNRKLWFLPIFTR